MFKYATGIFGYVRYICTIQHTFLVSMRERLLGVSNFSNFVRIIGIGIKEVRDMKLNHLYAVEILKCMCEEVSALDVTKAYAVGVCMAFFEAAKKGTVEVIEELSKANPQLLLMVEGNTLRNIFFLAVECRQEKIFSLIYGVESMKNSIITTGDKMANNMLHVAGFEAPSSQLARISGAALQMQRELQWYKEVEKVVSPSSKVCVNTDFLQPDEVFTKSHAELLKKGEEWMKANANSCSLVGALIITIMFTAAFTIPGGSDQNTGYPMLLNKKAFKVFMITDAISLFASTTSVLMFLGILTSRYAEDDFIKSLPTKLIVGLSTLFISIAAMMVAFCAALIIMMKRQLHYVIPISVLAGFPIAVFVWLQFPLLSQISISTYGPGIFNKKMKPWL